LLPDKGANVIKPMAIETTVLGFVTNVNITKSMV